MISEFMSQLTAREAKIAFVSAAWVSSTSMTEETAYAYLATVDDKALEELAYSAAADKAAKSYAELAAGGAGNGYKKLAALFDAEYLSVTDKAKLAEYYDAYMPSGTSESTLEKNYELIGIADKASPETISIYPDTFEDKDAIADIISEYNGSAAEENKISYTDYMALLMSGVTSIINAISYGLIAFVGISLVVSSIMIGIITYISVLERTKEIGILRSVGASKRDVSRVFNAETLIIGFAAGVIGIVVSLLFCLPINLIIHALSGISAINAYLPITACVVLVILSMILTSIAGLFPSGMAARKDPVEALRTE